MGAPARKRLVEKIFQEMRCNQAGIRMSNLPEALDRLGLTISPALKKILLRTDAAAMSRATRRAATAPNVVGRPRKDPLPAPPAGQYQERYVLGEQWRFIVNRLVLLLRRGADLEDVVDLFGVGGVEEMVGGDGDGDGGGGDSDTGLPQGEKGGYGGGRGGSREDKDVGYDDDDDYAFAERARRKSSSAQASTYASASATISAAAAASADSWGVRKSTGLDERAQYKGRPRTSTTPTAGSSRISEAVEFDRKNFLALQRDRERDRQGGRAGTEQVLRTDIQRRMDAHASSPDHSGEYFTEPAIREAQGQDQDQWQRTYLSQRQKQSQSQIFSDSPQGQGQGKVMGTLAIAEEFLRSHVGRQMSSGTATAAASSSTTAAASQRKSTGLDERAQYKGGPYTSSSSSGSDHSRTEYNLNPATAQRAAAQLLGLPPKPTSAAEAIALRGGVRGGARSGAGAGSGAALPRDGYRNYVLPEEGGRRRLSGPSSSSAHAHAHASTAGAGAASNAAPGWKSSKGGWVADFGAPHTHALYTGSEVNYATMKAGRAGARGEGCVAQGQGRAQPDVWTQSKTQQEQIQLQAQLHMQAHRQAQNHQPQSRIRTVEQCEVEGVDTRGFDKTFDPVSQASGSFTIPTERRGRVLSPAPTPAPAPAPTPFPYPYASQGIAISRPTALIDDGFSVDTAVAGAGEGGSFSFTRLAAEQEGDESQSDGDSDVDGYSDVDGDGDDDYLAANDSVSLSAAVRGHLDVSPLSNAY
ncbi:hypothetical protein B484DRAFT_443895 [Ochromonadaceae sp. CCMP2298]|nr:hypothetical protein B484DRAFT_443895 [Ochromonadaceae sp. CCMP2298]